VNSEINTAISGMQAQLDALEMLANNLANLNTTGFKEEKAFFALFNQSLDASQGSGDLNAAVNQSVLARGALNMADGSLSFTNRELDIAIAGNGFLVVETPRGVRYTRNGNLQLNAQSVLATSDGFPVLGATGHAITLGPGKIRITEDGTVSLDDAQVDRLKLVTFDNLSSLEKEGSSLFVSRASQGSEKDSKAVIKSGYLEQSNVDPISSVVRMVEIQRNFEALQKSVTLVMNDINAKVIDKLGH
jgi:flagellar basal-body rod protein FlgF